MAFTAEFPRKVGRRRQRWLTAFGATAVAGAMVAAASLAAPSPAAAKSDTSAPTVSGPVTGGERGFPFGASALPLADLGYVEEEFFFSGTAAAYTNAKPLTADGRWDVTASSTAPYTSRLLVRRPADRKKFNGVVVVEWLNVSAGYEIGGFWSPTAEHLLREGYAYVGVSAQAIGTYGFPPPAPNAGALKIWDPTRYAALNNPGDSYSYDIFSQAAQALRGEGGAKPLGTLNAKELIAVGNSQSGMRLNTYINAVAPHARAYDAFLVHSGFGRGAPLSQAPLPTIATPPAVPLRTDLRVPTLIVEGETETLLGALQARQPDTDKIRRWEVAGASHLNLYGFGMVSADALRAVPPPAAPLPAADLSVYNTCALPLNQSDQHLVYRAALTALTRWLDTRRPPPSAPLLEVTTASGQPAFVRDAVGNVVGGVRSTAVDVPVAVHSGFGNTAPCAPLNGSSRFLDAAALNALYPTHQDYVAKVSAAAGRLVREGYLTPADAARLVVDAARSAVGTGTATVPAT